MVHYIAGAGLHGCLYQCGPEIFESVEAAVDFLADVHELSKRRRRELKRDRYLELNLHRDGNEYCEIAECNCSESDHLIEEE